MRRLVAAVVIAAYVGGSCDSPNALARDVLRRSVPPGDTVPAPSAPVRTADGVQFVWDIETQRTDYADWAKRQFGDFAVVRDDPTQLRLAKMVSGDACRLLFVISQRSGIAHVHVEMTERPD